MNTFWFQLSPLEVLTPVLTTRKRWANTKIKDFSWIQQRTELSAQIATHHYLERQAYPKVTAKICLPGAEDVWEP